MFRRQFLAVAALFAFAGPALAEPAQVTVFAAASLQNALTDVGAAWKARTGKEVRFSFAASSAAARQIEQGAPADIFVSADATWMNYLAKKTLIVAASRRNILGNHLVLIAPADSTTTLKIVKNFPLAAELGDGRLAMAAPEVPAGKYGQAALTSLGVWPSVENRTARGENVRAALTFVARGEAPFGIVYETDARIEPKVKIVGTFPENSHAPIIYPAALVLRAPAVTANPDAVAFLTYLSGREAGAIFTRYGFIRPPLGGFAP